MTTSTTHGSRSILVDQLRALPDEAFTRLQYLSPQTGCFNRCAFCSQQAGREIWQLTPAGLTEVAAALSAVASERGLRIASGRIHRPGVLFPYLDNDIASYPHLDTLCALARDVLGVRLRISTVGYSRHNRPLAVMHQRIADRYGDVLDGVRLSLTPYTAGWARAAGTARQEYIADLAATLATYRPLLDRLGHGPATAAVELRFPPLVGLADLTDTVVGGRHVLACGPHLLISLDPHPGPLPVTVIDRLDAAGQPVLSTPGRRYLHLTGDGVRLDPETLGADLAGRPAAAHQAAQVTLFRFANADGDYYAADPGFHPDGRFTALHLYPATQTRRRSGYTDATRHFLGALLHHKAAYGLGRRDPFPQATWDDAAAVLTALAATASRLHRGVDHAAAAHLRRQVIPLVTAYATALETAGYPASVFFSRDFTIDTGQIVNQGRARGLFRGLAATDDEPMTPREERGYGAASLSAIRGTIWRIAPAPFDGHGGLPAAAVGGKNTPAEVPSLVVEELDPRHLRPAERDTGAPLRRYAITGVDLDHHDSAAGRAGHGYPGLPSPP